MPTAHPICRRAAQCTHRILKALADRLAESLAMMPAASVSGFYFSHPDSTYFNVGKIDADQVEDMVRRRGVAKADVMRALAPNL